MNLSHKSRNFRELVPVGELTELAFENPSATEEQFAILKSSVNPVRMKNHPVRLDLETIDSLYRQILR